MLATSPSSPKRYVAYAVLFALAFMGLTSWLSLARSGSHHSNASATTAKASSLSEVDRSPLELALAPTAHQGSAAQTPASDCAPPPSQMIGWWPGDGNANDIQGGNHGTLQNGATFTTGKVAQAFKLDGADDVVTMTDNTGALNITGSQVTIDAWIKLENNPTTAQKFTGMIGKNVYPTGQPYQFVFESGPIASNAANTLPQNQWQFEYILMNGVTRLHDQTTGVIITVDGLYHHFAMTYDGAVARLYVDGVIRYTRAFSGNLRSTPTVPVTIGGGAPFSADEVEIFNRALPQIEIKSIFDAGSAGKCRPQPTPTPTPTLASIQFSSTNYSVNEGGGQATITVSRSGITSNAVSVDYATTDGTAQQRTKYITTSGTLTFAAGQTSQTFAVLITDESYVEGVETVNLTLTNPSSGAGLGPLSAATLKITDNDVADVPTINPVDDAQFFVRQHYYDFLNRLPDQDGLLYWTDQITRCGADANCLNSRRIGVSAAYFIELEFQQTGYVVYRLYRAAYGALPNAPARANVLYTQFMSDRAQLVGGPQLQQSTADFANRFVQRTQFKLAYPDSMSAASFVNKLFDTASLTPFTTERAQEIGALQSNSKTRAQVLLDVIEMQAFKEREYNPAFVLMQYFGYLRRDPEQGGYDFWLNVLNNREPNNYRGMVCAFITSAEYQIRFAPIVTRNDAVCSIAPQSSLSVSKSGTGSGAVTSTPLGINCGNNCSGSYSNGKPLTLTASPILGSVFTGWSGGGCSGTGPCTLNLNASTSVSATFDSQPDSLSEFFAQTDPIMQDASNFFEQLAAQGDAAALQKTIDHIKSQSPADATLSPDGASILVSLNGLSRSLITDGFDRDDWIITSTQAAQPPIECPEDSAPHLATGEPGRTAQPLPGERTSASDNKEDRVLLLFPHRVPGIDELALTLKNQFRSAGKSVTTIGFVNSADKLGGMDLETMKSLGNYRVVFIYTHGALGTPLGAKSNDIVTGISSGIPIKDLPSFKALLQSGHQNQLGSANLAGGKYIFYTTNFFKSLDNISDTLFIVSACHSAQETGTVGGDLESAIVAKGGTFVGWDGTFYHLVAERAFPQLVGDLVAGKTIGQAVADVKANPNLNALTVTLVWLIYKSLINILDLKGNENFVLSTAGPSPTPTPTPSPSIQFCINTWYWIYPPGNWDTDHWSGSNSPGLYPYPGSPQCDIYPYVGCITTYTYACTSDALPNPCGAICGPR
jgi:hypothetical protein